MKETEFNDVINKLRSTYGDKYYLEIRTEFIWQQVKDLDARWFDKVVCSWIGANVKPMLVNEVREAALREQSRKLQADIDSPQRYQPMPDSVFSEKDIRLMFLMMRDKIDGRLTPDDWASFNKWVKEKAATSRQKVTFL